MRILMYRLILEAWPFSQYQFCQTGAGSSFHCVISCLISSFNLNRNILKDGNHMFISDKEKTFDSVHHPFMIKVLQRLG